MNDLSNKYAMSALKQRRGELAGEIQRFKSAIQYRQEQLAHIDASIRILDPGFPVDTIPPRRAKHVKLFRPGDLSRLVLDTLRREGKPMMAPVVAQAIADAQGYSGDAMAPLGHRVRANLAYQLRRGLVTKTGDRMTARWSLKEAPTEAV